MINYSQKHNFVKETKNAHGIIQGPGSQYELMEWTPSREMSHSCLLACVCLPCLYSRAIQSIYRLENRVEALGGVCLQISEFQATSTTYTDTPIAHAQAQPEPEPEPDQLSHAILPKLSPQSNPTWGGPYFLPILFFLHHKYEISAAKLHLQIFFG
ncbi:hypothetical protein Dsin_014579 [Dipteronia sinensis]|uniref:Uncharacterized protein n=1 Tax=Dipteronia sinensis TaxID=43782 RepID=A0AAE0ANB1_9ROSI|nr:hypothetical protein Dsin_014579 [Dipteronia sinensis]